VIYGLGRLLNVVDCQRVRKYNKFSKRFFFDDFSFFSLQGFFSFDPCKVFLEVFSAKYSFFFAVIFLGLDNSQGLPYLKQDYPPYVKMLSSHNKITPPLLPISEAINDVLEECLDIAEDSRRFDVLDCGDINYGGEEELDSCIEMALLNWWNNSKECHESQLWDRFKIILD
jgi:hypothetical protein